MERKWTENEEFFSFSLYFLPLYPFPTSKIVSFCRKISNVALLSRIPKKNLIYALRENNSGLRESSQVVRARSVEGRF